MGICHFTPSMHRLFIFLGLMLFGIMPCAVTQDGKLVATEYSPIGSVGSMVGIHVDNQNRVHVTQTYRRNNGALDIRRHRDWVVPTLASSSVEDKRLLIRERKSDWKSLFNWKEKIWRFEDPDDDGHFDKKTLFFEGLNTEVTGLAGGILFRDNAAYVTCIPDMLKITDTDRDGKADKTEILVTGFGIHVGYGGHDMHGPTMGYDGRIYWTIGDKGFSVRSREGAIFHYPYHGGMFRCEPDGSNFEVFAQGLRNPQELAFDEFGNWFIVDNDGDFGDRERFHFLVEGSDTGWRATWQYRTNGKFGEHGGYNPWLADGLWRPHFEGQPAYITPAISNYSDGPCGFAYNPGTALNEKYRNYFFVTEFPGKNIRAFRTEPVGAGFKMVDEHVAHNGLMTTGINFGPDGALYLADWGNNGWAPHEKGRIMKLDAPGAMEHPLRKQTRRLLADGFLKRDIPGLVRLLAHADQRVRLESQLELAKRNAADALLTVAKEDDSQLARIHAIWGIGQLGRRIQSAVLPLRPLLNDRDPEIQAQVLRVVGDAHHDGFADMAVDLLASPHPRVQLFAGLALGKIGSKKHVPAIADFLDANNNKDVFLRHAGVVALARAAEESSRSVLSLTRHPSESVRLAAVVALRRIGNSGVAMFLNDSSEKVANEAAHAIHDEFSITAAMPSLAGMLDVGLVASEPILRRAINANLRLGRPQNAQRLAKFAIRETAPESMRVEAIRSLAIWETPPKLDRVEGRYRDLGVRPVEQIYDIFDQYIGNLLSSKSDVVREAAADAISRLNYGNAAERLSRLANDKSLPAQLRASAVEALYSIDADEVDAAVAMAIKTKSPLLRTAAVRVLAKRNAKSQELFPALNDAINSADLREKQNAFGVLGTLKSQEAIALLEIKTQQLINGTAPSSLQLDILEAAKANRGGKLAQMILDYDAGRAKRALVDRFSETLEGGDAMVGESIFRTNFTAQCIRCHKVGQVGGDVGPNLNGLAKRLDGRAMLESLIDPQAKIADGYGLVTFTMKNGEILAGSIEKKSANFLSIKDQSGARSLIKTADIKSRSKSVSSMPPMMGILTPRDLRDLVAYMKTLK
jgi:putative membrane-bound dehydrogenase-like protein